MSDLAGKACPYCAQKIHEMATRCKHCHEMLLPRRPPHGGTCPYCREDIPAEALRCHHCEADVSALLEPSPFIRAARRASRASGTGGGTTGSAQGGEAECFTGYIPWCREEPVPQRDGAGYVIVCEWREITVCA